MGRRRPAWKILGALVALLLLGIGVFFTWVQAVAARRWAAFEKRVPELVAEARGRDPRRPPRGEGVPGNAWTDYRQAMMGAGTLNPSDLADFVARAPKADRAKAEAAVAAHEGLLAFLSAGARRAEGTYPYEFEKGFAAPMPGLLETQKVAQLAVSKARLLAEAGKCKEAAELLLDALWFAADQGHNALLIAEMISSANLALALDELRMLAVDPTAEGVDWPQVGRELARLESFWPDHGVALLNEGVCAAVTLRDAGAGGGAAAGLPVGALLAWRYGFSGRLMLVDAAERHAESMRRVAEASRTWAEVERVAREIQAEAQAAPNLLTRMITPGLMSSHRVGFERLAQLRLLRTAVALRAGEAAPDLDDPFGGKLRRDASKIWSVGADGVDGGGIGAWKPAKTGDIVLDLKSK